MTSNYWQCAKAPSKRAAAATKSEPDVFILSDDDLSLTKRAEGFWDGLVWFYGWISNNAEGKPLDICASTVSHNKAWAAAKSLTLASYAIFISEKTPKTWGYWCSRIPVYCHPTASWECGRKKPADKRKADRQHSIVVSMFIEERYRYHSTIIPSKSSQICQFV